MATKTLGTAATTTLTALQFQPGWSGAQADFATLSALLKDQTAANNVFPAALSQAGQLYLPQTRGIIQLLPGDYVAVDPVTGWPIVLNAAAAAGASFVHT